MAGVITEDINGGDSGSEEEYRAGVESKPAEGSLDSEGNAQSILEKSNADSDMYITSSDTEEDMEPEEILRSGYNRSSSSARTTRPTVISSKSEEECQAGMETKPYTASSDSKGNESSIRKSITISDMDNMTDFVTKVDSDNDGERNTMGIDSVAESTVEAGSREKSDGVELVEVENNKGVDIDD